MVAQPVPDAAFRTELTVASAATSGTTCVLDLGRAALVSGVELRLPGSTMAAADTSGPSPAEPRSGAGTPEADACRPAAGRLPSLPPWLRSVETSADGQAWAPLVVAEHVAASALHASTAAVARYLRVVQTAGTVVPATVRPCYDLRAWPSLGQLGQDKWVSMMLGARRDGSFVEIGSTDGVAINNTCNLERLLGWTGICVEPNRGYFKQLVSNRSAVCVDRAIFRETGRTVRFVEAGEYGTILDLVASDKHRERREQVMAEASPVEVTTLSPADLLKLRPRGDAVIDYLSLDTEGSEWDILQGIDLHANPVTLLTVEHNFVADRRNAMRDHLRARGYRRVAAKFDDWYFHPDLVGQRRAGPVDTADVLAWWGETAGFREE